MRYAIEPRDRIYVKGYGFLSFAKNMGKNLSNKYSQKLLDSAKKSTTDAIKTASKRAIQKTAETTGDLIGNTIADKITSLSKKYPKELKNDEAEVPKKRYISPEERQQIINELKLVQQYNNGISTNNKFVRIASNQPSKFRTKNWVEINDESRGAYSVNRQITFKTSLLRSSLCDYGDAYTLAKGQISVNNTAAGDANANNTDKKVILKSCAPFTDYIIKIYNTQVDNAKDFVIVMPMYNLIEYSVNYSKTSGHLWKYCKYISAVNVNDNIVDFNGANATDSFNFKTKITGQTDNNGRI